MLSNRISKQVKKYLSLFIFTFMYVSAPMWFSPKKRFVASGLLYTFLTFSGLKLYYSLCLFLLTYEDSYLGCVMLTSIKRNTFYHLE